MIRYRTDGTHPTDHNDGTLVCDKTAAPGSEDSFTHIELQNGTTYYYSAFTYDEVPNYSETAHASATPTASGPPPNVPPTASVSDSPISGTAPLSVSFTGSGSDTDGTITSYSWGFGDGQTSTNQNPTHTYNAAGNYTATLTVTDDDGATGSDTVTISVTYYDVPIGGYNEDNVIPAAQDDQKIISQSTDGNGIITIKFKIRHAMEVVGCTLHTFQYSVDGGETWNAPQNEDNSECLNQGQDPTWSDNGGAGYPSAADFDSAEEHSFTFTTKHADVAGLDNVEQDDVRIRFMINDGTDDSPSPVTSQNFRVDNYPPFAPSW